MDKKRFLEILGKNEDFDLIKLYEKIQLAKNKGIPIFTSEFYTPDIWTKVENLTLKHVQVKSYGVFSESDRRIIAFNQSYEEFPIKVLKIKCNTKFTKLEHKDYLGAIMALGIKRSKIGELILFNDLAYLVVHDDMIDYIILNLIKIKNLTCKCEVVDIINENIKFQYEERTVISTSTRVDCIIASLCNISRSKASTLLSQGKVLVNYEQINEKSNDVKSNSKITIRGFGKFKIKDIIGTTKNGRLKLIVLKYT
ncbi:RNA-binding protein [Clostridium tarantellae]|uniref:RNA-binding protein n=1 Tax=Clostridium tarantellae TaxID=39493 RepID=A0A6I1MKQ8_9CLOT|nr:YlmH/Sll1252 family protein [Clostridium tarantellae]MPQ43985.1 RNA-binding protein [Clostridium tarantellae]